FEGDAQGPVKLVRTDPLLRSGNEIHRLKPNVHGNVAGLEDGPDLDGEGLPALVALVRADSGGLAAHLANAIEAAAMRADGAVRPNARLNVGIVCLFAVEVR